SSDRDWSSDVCSSDLVVAAYDVETGRELWTQSWNAGFTDETGDGPRSTPTWDDGRLYALGATGEFRCLDAKTGAVIWGKNILSEIGRASCREREEMRE